MIRVLFAFVSGAFALSCKDESGSSVSWWMGLKFPKDSSNPDYGSGYSYVYADANSPSFKLSSHLMSSTSSGAAAETLAQVYGASSSTGYVFYNDEHPDGKTSTSYAHSKGVVGFTSSTGFWYIHSYPKYPDAPTGSYTGVPSAEAIYGQSMLCISIDNADDVAKMLLVNKPYIYGQQALSDMSKFPLMQGVMNAKWNRDATGTSSTIAGFKVFAKNSEWAKDLYEDLVAPGLSSDLQVETWCRGTTKSPCLDSYCTPHYSHDVENVNNMTVPSYASWSRYADHSKWAMSTTSSKGYVCIGDINRMESQRKRGGGTACIKSSGIWSSLNKFVTNKESC